MVFILITADLLSKTGRASSSDKLQTVKSKLEEKSSIKIEEEVKENQAPVEKIRTPGRDGKYLSSQVFFSFHGNFFGLYLKLNCVFLL